MKKTLLTLLLLLSCSLGAFAQTEKGGKEVGGSFSMSYMPSADLFHFALLPQFSYFVIDNLSIGGSLSAELAASEGQLISTFTILPTAKYYFEASPKLKPYLMLQVGGGILTARDGSGSLGSGGVFQFGGGAGVAYFLTRNVALDLGLRVRVTSGVANIAMASGFGFYF